MTARHVLAVGLLVAGLTVVPVAAAAGADETPGPVDLELKVDRLEHATQADVVGSEASSMLFAPRDTAALAAAADARAAARASDAGALFLGPAVPARPPVTAETLFGRVTAVGGGGTDGSTSSRSATGGVVARGAPDEALAGPPWGLGALGALLVSGSALSYVVRERLGVAGE